MKLLYVGNNRDAAQLAAGALLKAGLEVTLTWAERLSDAMLWVRNNQDFAAAVVEDHVQAQSCVWFVRQVRSLGLTAPVLVVSSRDAVPPLGALKAGADDYIPNDESLLIHLPDVVGRALRQAQPKGGPERLRFLYLGDATLARASLKCSQYAIEIVEPAWDSSGDSHPIPPEFPGDADALLVEHGRPGVDIFAILKHVAARRSHIPVILVVEWEEELILPALRLGAIDYVVKSTDSFQALVFRLDRVLAHSTLLDEQVELRESVEQAAAIRASLEERLAHAEMAAPSVAQGHPAMTTAVDEHHTAGASDATGAERSTGREAALAATLAAATATREALDRRLVEVETALQRSEERAAADRQAAVHEASRREAEYKAQLDQEIVVRNALQEKLADAAEVCRVAAQRHASMKTALEHVTERQAQHESQLAQAASTREMLERQLSSAAEALEQAAQARASAGAVDEEASRQRHARVEAQLAQEAAARNTAERGVERAEAALRDAVERHTSQMTEAAEELAKRDAQFEATMAETTAARDALARRLAEADTARQQTEERATADREASLRAASQREASLHAASRREAEFEARLEQDVATRAMLEEQLRHAEMVVRAAAERHASMTAAATQVTERYAEQEARLAQAAAAHATLARQLNGALMALERTEQARASDVAEAAERLSRREAELAATVSETATTRETLERRLADAAAAVQRLEQRALDEGQAAALEAARREAELEGRLERDAAARATLEGQLRQAGTVVRAAAERHASMTAAATQAAERQAEYEARLADAAAARTTFEQQLSSATAAVEQAQQARASEVAAVTERFTLRDAQFEATMAETTAARDALARRLAEADTARQQTEERATADREASLRAASQREAEFEARLEQEVIARGTLERSVERAEAALRDAVERHASELTTTAARVAERQAEYEAQSERATAARVTHEQQLSAASMALERVEEARASDAAEAAERLSRREAELAATVSQTALTREALERRLADADAAVQLAEQRALDERQAAAHLSERQAQYETQLTQAAAAREALERQLSDAAMTLERMRQVAADAASQREIEFEGRLDEERRRRDALERELAETRTASASAQGSLRDEVASIRERETLVAEQAARERADRESVLADAQGRVRDLELETATLRQSLETSQQGFQLLEDIQKREREDVDRARVTSEAQLRQLASERSRLEALVIERDAELKQRAATHAAAEQALRTETSDRVAQLQHQLDETRAVHRRQFERTPSSMLRCGRGGALEQVNDALAAMLGYRTAAELRAVNLATTVFESPDDLRSLIDRCFSAGTTVSAETTWLRRDGARLVVRLLAVETASGEVDIVAEDLTDLRRLEERLRQARRMEAVGRLASEVAATCDNLLRDVSQGGHQWLATIDSGTAMRHQGELLLNEVTRAASFLRQLESYGKTEASALQPVDVNRVLRDLEPVLRRVAGDDIEFVLPTTSSPVSVDVELQRVERILVNMAAYGRERLPFGGRLTFELADVTVGRESVAEHPTFRPGAHVLITVTAVRYAVRWDATRLPHVPAAANTSGSVPADRPGVDLGAVQALIRDCGGHLWIAAEPPGDMVLKIHLPRGADGATDARASGSRSKDGRPMGRWFRTRH